MPKNKPKAFTPLETLIARPKAKRFLTGFTLAELLLAAAILAVALCALLATFSYTMILNQSSSNNIVAVNDAQYVMELFKTMSFSQIQGYKAAGNYTVPSLANLPSENISVTFGAGTDPIQVEVAVNWLERQRARQIKLASRFTNLQ